MNIFNKLVKFHFHFIEKYGYKSIKSDNKNSVLYFNGKCEILLLYDPIGYEITCNFNIIKDGSFSLQEALDYADISNALGAYQISNEDCLEKGVVYLSETLFALFSVVDFSNECILKSISDFVQEKRKNNLEQYYFESDMKLVEKYWKEQRYQEAQCLLEKHSNCLSKMQAQKLDYLIKHI